MCSRIPAGIQRGHAFRPSPIEMRKPYGISGGFVEAGRGSGALQESSSRAAQGVYRCEHSCILHPGVQLLLGQSVCSRAGRQQAWLSVGVFLRLFLQAYSTLQRSCEFTQKLFGRNQTCDPFSVITVTKRCLDLMTCRLARWACCSEHRFPYTWAFSSALVCARHCCLAAVQRGQELLLSALNYAWACPLK